MYATSARTARKPHQDVYRTGPVPSGFCSHNKHLHTLLFRLQHLRPKNMGRSDVGRFVSTPAILARSGGELQSPEITQTHTRHTTSPHANVRQKTRSIHDPLEFPVLARHHHFTTREERPSVTLSNTRSKKIKRQISNAMYTAERSHHLLPRTIRSGKRSGPTATISSFQDPIQER